MPRLAHISDLHFGALDPDLVRALEDDLHAFHPDVVLVSGDLTQRAWPRQLKDARAFLDRLPWPKVVVAGNHDVAPWFSPVERALAPFLRFRRWIGSERPPPLVMDDPQGALVVLGLNTVDPFRLVEGGVARDELARVLAEAHRHAHRIHEAFVVVVAHHPLIETEIQPLANRVRRHASLEETFDQAGIDLAVTGHLHESWSGPSTVRATATRHVLAVQGSTATSTRLYGHKNAWNAITIELPAAAANVRIDVRISDGGAFHSGGVRQWRRSGLRWQSHT